MISNFLTAALTAAGGILSAREYRKQKRSIESDSAASEDYYRKALSEDAAARSDSRRFLRLAEDRLKDARRQSAGMAAVAGQAEGAEAAEKEADARSLADAVSQIDADAADRKDRLQAQRLNRRDQYRMQLNALRASKSANIASAVKSLKFDF